MRFGILTLAFSLILLSGCLSLGTNGIIPASDRLGTSDLTVARFANPTDPDSFVCLEVPGDRPCWCMFCQNHTSTFSFLQKFPIIGQYFGPSLREGSCAFEACNQQTYNETLVNQKDNKFPRALMIGAGPSFASTALATRYCNYSLQIATKWMIGKDGAAPPPPASSRAACWLERDIIPLYIYYTGGQKIDQAATLEIAGRLNKDSGGDTIGPVMVTTELEFDGADPSAVSKVRGQIDALRTCEKCLVVLAINAPTQEARLAAVESILGKPGAYDLAYYQKVDLIGFGFRANDYPDCKVEGAVGENYIFSREIMRRYSKPTIWLYAGASEGKNALGTCQWDAQMVHNFYQNIFALQQGMASSGVAGVSFYEFRDGAGPLPCAQGEGCGFGLLEKNGSQKHPALNTWSDLCTKFGTMQVNRPPLIFSRNTFGYKCDIQTGDQLFDYVSREYNTDLGLKSGAVSPVAARKGLSCGEVCPSDYDMPNRDAYDETGAGFSSAANCGKYPEIDEYADDRDVSATFFKAMVDQESGFDPLIVSCTNESNPGCNPYGLNMSEICRLSGLPENCGAHVPQQYGGGTACPAGMKICAYGLAQCVDYPGRFYVENSGLAGERRDAAYKCGGDGYNPFNPENSICCGLNVFQEKVSAATGFVAGHWPQLSACSGGLKEEDRGWAIYFVAASYYHGDPIESLLSDFLSQRDSGGSCKKEQNFIRYVRSLKDLEGKPKYTYAANVMTSYRDAVGKCDSDCPK